MSDPRPHAPPDLPPDFAAALGRAVAAFGFLEEALKRAVHAFSLDNLGDSPDEAALQDWVSRMTQLSGDSLGALIDALIAALRRGDGRVDRTALAAELRAVREWRNLICHASWAPAGQGGFRPGFVSNRGLAPPARMEAADMERLRARTAALAASVIALARATGDDSWTPDPGAARRAAERARARARAAARQAQRSPPPPAAREVRDPEGAADTDPVPEPPPRPRTIRRRRPALRPAPAPR